VHRIPATKIPQSLKECYFSALNLWQGGRYAEREGGLLIAVGLWILALEEIGKYVLLEEAAARQDSTGMFEVLGRDFTNHDMKSEKGLAAFKKWGLDLQKVGIPLTSRMRTGLWFVAWNDETQEFKRAITELDPYAITRVHDLGELMLEGLNRMKELLRISQVPLALRSGS